jgi:hypothetical protein
LTGHFVRGGAGAEALDLGVALVELPFEDLGAS